ncbi:diguanylate cyclase [Nodosilinea sp. LEGE 06152]|uniref:diguanylate cyclase n=1 Tax=Nodosilinea sp. LEGE 06152 TaxID=2777966 RepID=UPI0018812083|nr:diguanylate cyclase [Nodosilinea sp. LEGE 06152]MBE9156511.1 diguanylate cyclase [Nodosilinea sp. LEGE 06152]
MARAVDNVAIYNHGDSVLPTPLTWARLVAAIALQTHQSSDLATILRVAVEGVQQLLGCDRVLVYQLAPGSGGRVLVEAFSDPRWSLRDRMVQDRCFEADWPNPYQEGLGRAIADVATASLPPCYANFLANLGVKASSAIPVLCESRLWGLLVAHSCTGPRRWPAVDLEGLQHIAVQIGIAVHQAELVGQLQTTQAALEAQVAARTYELEQINQQLAARVEAYEQGRAALHQGYNERVHPAGAVELALQNSEATTRALVAAIPDLLLRMRQDGSNVQLVNPGTIRMVNLDNTLAGHRITELMPQAIAEERIHLAHQALKTGEIQQQEYNFAADGQTFYEEARIAPIGDDEVLVVIRDISARKCSEAERKWAELNLKSAKDQLELVLQASSEGFCDWDLVTGEIYFSPQWKALLGYADHELENSQEMWRSLILEADLAKTLQLIDDYNSDRIQDFTTTQRFRHKDGSVVHMLSRAIHLKDDQGNVVRMVSSYLDMTQTVEIQQALKTSEMQLSSILNSAPDGIMAFRSVRDQQGTIVDFEWLLSNPASCQIIGQSVDHILGKRLLEEMPGNGEAGLFDRYVTVVESGEPMQHEFYYNHDGINCWFENIAVKLGDGFAVTFRDITEIKQSKITLQQTNQQLEDRISELDQRHSEMLVLSEISDFLQACSTVEEACHTIVNLLEPLFPHCSGGIFTTSASLNRLEQVVAWGVRLHSHSEFEPHCCWGLRRGRMHWVGQDRLSLRCSHISAQAALPLEGHSTAIAVTLCIPMIAQGETLGLFHLSTEVSEALPEAKQQLARTLAEQVGMAIANLKLQETLKHQSIRDPLTGLYNRRYLEESLAQEVARAQRKQLPIGVVMLDIDHFKRFNDTFGHNTGDMVLKLVGTLLKDKVRHSDVACRYGGEEMTLILPEASLTETAARADLIRAAISELQVPYQGQPIDRLTASFGVACFPHHGSNSATLLQAADAALYRAKQAGRNQVVVAL